MQEFNPLSREANPIPRSFWILILVVMSLGGIFLMLNPDTVPKRITFGKLLLILFLTLTSSYGTIALIRDYKRGGFLQWIKRYKGKLDANED